MELSVTSMPTDFQEEFEGALSADASDLEFEESETEAECVQKTTVPDNSTVTAKKKKQRVVREWNLTEEVPLEEFGAIKFGEPVTTLHGDAAKFPHQAAAHRRNAVFHQAKES